MRKGPGGRLLFKIDELLAWVECEYVTPIKTNKKGGDAMR